MSARNLILLADDDRNDAFFLRQAFMKAGALCSILDVRNGKQAINYLNGDALYQDRGIFPLPRLVILDIKMPMVDGFEVLTWLQGQPALAHVPVIVLSGSGLRSDVTKARELGARDYLIKPNDPAELVKMAKHVNDTWLS
jgi:CheY-like chemotaxis protein